ncbi:hypothetical protein HZF24_11905 [Sedimentibacter hydroxybenzoicus DSM 7310]|uniref:Uncharacterized protein n=1 Tax=Sedimentibacter hydroxybenzoicus DSM 7310 TaxID=1123245 RepID=A0A974GWT5_SEDHY|nr:hypothetical protein [Sedimentibacter hydroxybenzoicus]NYB74842.1 hypothetical protein [Sedimentibacter hydroxybenzoicus DSM 7310]
MRENEEFKPFVLSLYKLCKKTDKLTYLLQIRNRILRLVEENENFGEFVKFYDDDVYLNCDGIYLFTNVLKGYFEEELIEDIHKYIYLLNEYSQNEYNLDCMLRDISTQDLRNLAVEAMKYLSKEEKLRNARQMVIERVGEELRRRNIITRSIDTGKTVIEKVLEVLK